MFNILVVEDNSFTRENIVKVLNQHIEGCQVFEADTGQKAIKIFNDNRIDLFFLDIELPDTTGLDIAKKIRNISHYEFTFLVFITSHVTLMQKALHEFHCYDFIEKPFKMDTIIRIVKKLMGGNKGEAVVETKKYLSLTKWGIVKKYLLSDIFFVDTMDKAVNIHTKWGVCRETKLSLKKIMEILEEQNSTDFIRSHKAYIVNTQYINDIVKISRYSWQINFLGYDKFALVGEKYMNDIEEKMKWSE